MPISGVMSRSAKPALKAVADRSWPRAGVAMTSPIMIARQPTVDRFLFIDRSEDSRSSRVIARTLPAPSRWIMIDLRGHRQGAVPTRTQGLGRMETRGGSEGTGRFLD